MTPPAPPAPAYDVCPRCGEVSSPGRWLVVYDGRERLESAILSGPDGWPTGETVCPACAGRMVAYGLALVSRSGHPHRVIDATKGGTV